MLYERIKLEDDEEILLTVRKHWWIIVTRVATVLFLAILPLVLFSLVRSVTTESVAISSTLEDLLTQYDQLLTFFYLAWLLFCWILLANYFTDHYLDLWTITNRRIVSIDQRGFFSRFLSSFRLERLQDMNIEVTGIIPTLLNFGTIEAQTAGGSNEEFKTDHMPDPRGLKALIINAADERQRIVENRVTTDGL